MRHSIFSLLALATLVLVPSAEAQERQLKDSDLKKFAQKLADYVEAKMAYKDVLKSEDAVSEELVKLRKKLKGKDPLGLPADMGQALWLSHNYTKKRIKSKGKLVEEDGPDNFAEPFKYAIVAPSKYSAKQAYPLILCIPEEGKAPKEFLTERFVESELRDNCIIAAVPMPEDKALWAEGGSQEEPGGVALLLSAYKVISETYAIDFDRVYIAGRGVGVAPALQIAERFPARFAGVIGRAGDAGETKADNFRNLPTWFAGAGAKATAFKTAVDELGYKNCTLDAEGKGEEIWAWMQSNARKSNPSEVTLVPGVPFPNRTYWLQIPPWDGHGTVRVEGKIDLATNTITIDAQGVKSVILYFNDSLVDLEKPVKVICNGVESVDEIPRNFKLFLDMIFKKRSDPGRMYVASRSYDVPAKEGDAEESVDESDN